MLVQWLRRNWMPLAGIAGFCVLAVLVYGGNPLATGALPQCACGDEAQEVWFLAWPAYALSHGLNPFFSQAVAYPHGVNLMSSTSMPLLGTALSPVTLTLGPVAAYNLLARLALAASATTMSLVLRRYTRAWPAALAGGLLYGFSPFFMAQGLSHLYLTFAVIPPLFLPLLEDLLVRQQHPLRSGILLGLAATVQLLISAEVLAMAGLVALGVVVVLVARHPVAARERLQRALAAAGAAVVTFGVLGAYPLWQYAAGPQHVSGRQHPAGTYVQFHDDLLGTVYPTSQQLIGGSSLQSHGNLLIQGNGVDHAFYLGVPLILLLAFLAVRFRRVGLLAISALVTLGALVLSLGTVLYVNGSGHLTALKLPYDLLLHLPGLDGILAPRFAMAMYFGAAVVLAVGLDQLAGAGAGADRTPAAGVAGSRTRLLLRAGVPAALGVVALVPLVPQAPFGSTAIPVPSLFRTPALLDRVPAGGVVLTYPNAQVPTVNIPTGADARSMLWQAVAGMRFSQIGAYAAQPAPGGGLGQGDVLLDKPVVVQRFFGWALYGSPAVTPVPVTPAALQALRDLCRHYDVSAILVDPTVGVHPAAVVDYVTRALGRAPEEEGGVDAWFDVATPLVSSNASAMPATTTVPAATTSTSTTPAPATTTTVEPGTLPQTRAYPSATTPAFSAEMDALWSAVVAGRPALAARSFFPEAAYEQVKAIPDPAADYQNRLVAAFDADVLAAHAWLGAGAPAARLVSVEVASSEASWIDPGGCYNRVGYWHAPGARLVYVEGGVTRSIGIASLISWRGVWYVVHFGAVLRTGAGGVVDDPATGPGSLPPAGGC